MGRKRPLSLTGRQPSSFALKTQAPSLAIREATFVFLLGTQAPSLAHREASFVLGLIDASALSRYSGGNLRLSSWDVRLPSWDASAHLRFLVRQCRLLLAETQPRLSSADPRAHSRFWVASALSQAICWSRAEGPEVRFGRASRLRANCPPKFQWAPGFQFNGRRPGPLEFCPLLVFARAIS